MSAGQIGGWGHWPSTWTYSYGTGLCTRALQEAIERKSQFQLGLCQNRLTCDERDSRARRDCSRKRFLTGLAADLESSRSGGAMSVSVSHFAQSEPGLVTGLT